MRKLILGAAALMFLSVISCKNTVEKVQDTAEEAVEGTANAAEAVAETVKEEANDAVDAVKDAVDGVPSFTNPAAQGYVTAYEGYISEYAKAVEAKDVTVIAGLAKKGKDLSAQATEIASKLTGDEAKKWSDYVAAKSAQVQEFTKALSIK